MRSRVKIAPRVPVQTHQIGVTAEGGMAEKEEGKSRITVGGAFAIGVIVDLVVALMALHAQIKDFIWTHPWTHSLLVLIPAIALPILAFLELRHSKEANNLRAENLRVNEKANDLRSKQTEHLATITELQSERNGLQAELNELQAQRNESLGQIADSVKKEPTPAEKTAAKLRNRIGERAYVTNSDGGSWGSMGAIIAEVNEDILTLFTPASQDSSRAIANFVQCDKLQLVEVQMGGCSVQIKVLERFGAPVDYGEARSWGEPTGATKTLPRGTMCVFSANYRKEGIAEQRSIHVYAPTEGNPNYTLVTRDKNCQQETGEWHCATVKELAAKFSTIQLEWVIDEKYKHSGGTGPSGLFLFSA
jgi:hypothetical protein